MTSSPEGEKSTFTKSDGFCVLLARCLLLCAATVKINTIRAAAECYKKYCWKRRSAVIRTSTTMRQDEEQPSVLLNRHNTALEAESIGLVMEWSSIYHSRFSDWCAVTPNPSHRDTSTWGSSARNM